MTIYSLIDREATTALVQVVAILMLAYTVELVKIRLTASTRKTYPWLVFAYFVGVESFLVATLDGIVWPLTFGDVLSSCVIMSMVFFIVFLSSSISRESRPPRPGRRPAGPTDRGD